MSRSYSTQTATGAGSEALASKSVRTASALDQIFDPFRLYESAPTDLHSPVWLTRDYLEDTIGDLLGANNACMMLVPSTVSNLAKRTSVSHNRQRNFEVVFNAMLHGMSCVSVSLAETPRISSVVEEWSLVGSADDPAVTQDFTYLESSLSDIQTWLGIGLQQATEAAGISRGTVYAWRDRGSSKPRPATVQGVLRLHGLVASAVRAAGRDGARQWFHSGEPSPLTQLVQGHGDAEVTRQVSKQLRRELTMTTPPPPNSWLAANRVDLSE